MNEFWNVHNSSFFLKKGGDDIYDVAKLDGGLCIDGDAASGYVTKILLQSSSCNVLAFKPFIGNFPHFHKTIGDDSRCTFYQKALGCANGNARFYVSRTVDGSQPGWGHLQGYSSEGYLVADDFHATKGTSFDVETARLEDYIIEDVTLLKLDLQGGEYDALVGAGTKLGNVLLYRVFVRLEAIGYSYVE